MANRIIISSEAPWKIQNALEEDDTDSSYLVESESTAYISD